CALRAANALGAVRVAAGEIAGRACLEDVIAPCDNPAFDNALMDGYALRAADAAAPLPVQARIVAGDAPPPDGLRGGHCIEIMTGAAIPRGADAVIAVEEISIDAQGRVICGKPVKAGQNIRRTGTDYKMRDIVARKGQRLHAG